MCPEYYSYYFLSIITLFFEQLTTVTVTVVWR